MKKIVFFFCASFAFFTFTSFNMINVNMDSDTPNCQQGEKLAQNTWVKWGHWNPNIQLTTFKEQANRLKSDWKWIANNSDKKIGPRRLEIDGSTESETLGTNTKNTFVSSPSLNNKVTITINKYDGKAPSTLAICTHAQNGTSNTVTTYEFAKGDSTEVKTFVVNNARGKIITVALKNPSKEDKFKYRIKAK